MLVRSSHHPYTDQNLSKTSQYLFRLGYSNKYLEKERSLASAIQPYE